MAVFTDQIAGRNITIGNVADWTQAANLPNGDNSSTPDGSIASTSYTGGDNFHIGNGSAWSSEMWLYVGSNSNAAVFMNANVGGSALGWYWFAFTGPTITFRIFNTGVSAYMDVSTSLSTSTWYHLVATKAAGADLRLYRDGVLVNSSTSTSGTPQAPSSSYRLWLATHGDGSSQMPASWRIAKLAVYQSVLTPAQVAAHYLHMVVT